MSIKQQLDNFREVAEKKGFREASYRTRIYLRQVIYDRTGLAGIIRYYLLVPGRSTLLWILYVRIYKPILEKKIGSGVKIMNKDWDNLVLLDAYRADYFSEYSSLEGHYESVVSKGNHSHEFVAKNFADGKYHDTVVVTSNIWYEKSPCIDESTFHTLINPVGVNDRSMTNPEKVTKAALDAIENFPNKRIIVHYMSPHTPFMGETAGRFETEGPWQGIYEKYRRGEIEKGVVEQSYIETIRAIENEVQQLINEFNGKTVVSSDHGENLGEVQHGVELLGHGNPSPECRSVPWLEMNYDERRNITKDSPIGFNTLDEKTVEKRLEYLGYK